MKRLTDIGELEHVAEILRSDIDTHILAGLEHDALLDLGGLEAEEFTEFYNGLALPRRNENSKKYKRETPNLNALETAAYKVLMACRNAAHGFNAQDLQPNEIEGLISYLQELVMWRNSAAANNAVTKIKTDQTRVTANAKKANDESQKTRSDKAQEIRDWYRARAQKLIERGTDPRDVASILVKRLDHFEEDHPNEKPRSIRTIRGYLKASN